MTKYCVVHYTPHDQEILTKVSVFGPFDNNDEAARCACSLIPIDWPRLPVREDTSTIDVDGVTYECHWTLGGNLVIIEPLSEQYWLVQSMLV